LVWPVSHPPVSNGAVLIDGEGRITAVGPDAKVPRPAGVHAHEYPDAVLLPGFVNVHTHLELTGLRGQIAETDFFAWIQHVRRAKEAMDPRAYVEAACAGVREAWRHGTTTVADTGTSGAAAAALTDLGGSGIAYHEVVAPHPAQADEALAAARAAIDQLRRSAGPWVTIGVSPHAPYTVSEALFRRVVQYARADGLAMAVHVAESQAEVEFLTGDRGAFADAWRSRGIPRGAATRSPVAWLDGLGILGERLLAIHAVQTDAADTALLRRAGCAVALCPRSNRRHGHGPPPLARYLEAGLRIGLGTDSVASVDSLDILAEARAAAELAPLGPEVLLEMLTLGGAWAVGLDREIGSLEPGKRGDLCVVRVGRSESAAPHQAAAAVLRSGPERIAATYVAGRCVHGGPA
jgi:5-methylthioadenosine/S-adenosylhomocysteine deaminase